MTHRRHQERERRIRRAVYNGDLRFTGIYLSFSMPAQRSYGVVQKLVAYLGRQGATHIDLLIKVWSRPGACRDIVRGCVHNDEHVHTTSFSVFSESGFTRSKDDRMAFDKQYGRQIWSVASEDVVLPDKRVCLGRNALFLFLVCDRLSEVHTMYEDGAASAYLCKWTNQVCGLQQYIPQQYTLGDTKAIAGACLDLGYGRRAVACAIRYLEETPLLCSSGVVSVLVVAGVYDVMRGMYNTQLVEIDLAYARWFLTEHDFTPRFAKPYRTEYENLSSIVKR